MPAETMPDYLARLKAEGRTSPFDATPATIIETQAQRAARLEREAAAEAEAKAIAKPDNKGAKA